MRGARRGFTLVELLVAVTIVGILAAIGLPKFRDLRRRATATQIVGDFDVVRHAAMSFLTDSGYFPPEVGSGQISPSLLPYFPTNFRMAKEEWTMDYDYVKVLGVQIVAVSFLTPDDQLGETAMKLLGHSTTFAFGGKYTVVISGM
jgi:prepilin-type N-terminal cleavage/methylation domain-containing protein